MKEQTPIELRRSTSGYGMVRVSAASPDLSVEFEYGSEGSDWVGKLVFQSVVAYRFRDEMRSRGFVRDSYDRLLVLPASQWIQELKKAEPDGMNDVEKCHHHAVFFSNNGYLEVAAESAQLLTSTRGTLG